MEDPQVEDFVMTVSDVFNLKGRGIVAVGQVESGTLRTGDEVEIWDAGQFVMTAAAGVELICRRPPIAGEIGLRLGHVDMSKLRAGQTVRRSHQSNDQVG